MAEHRTTNLTDHDHAPSAAEPHQVVRSTELLHAVLNCPHSITDERIVFHYDPKQSGLNALAQLGDRLAGGLTAVPVKVGLNNEQRSEAMRMLADLAKGTGRPALSPEVDDQVHNWLCGPLAKLGAILSRSSVATAARRPHLNILLEEVALRLQEAGMLDSMRVVRGMKVPNAGGASEQASTPTASQATCTRCKEYRDATGERVMPLCRCKAGKSGDASTGGEADADAHLDTDQIISLLLLVPAEDKVLRNLCEQAALKLFSLAHDAAKLSPQQAELGAADFGALEDAPSPDPLQQAALVAEIDWCLDEGHCGPRTRALLQRIRNHQAAGLMPARRPLLPITLRQAESLVRFFGGHDAEVAVVPYKDGLLAWDIECPEEGSQWLGPTEVDDDLAANGRPSTSRPEIWKTTHPAVCVPITDIKTIADGWKAHGYDVVEFYPGPQDPLERADIAGTADSCAIAGDDTTLVTQSGAAPAADAEDPR